MEYYIRMSLRQWIAMFLFYAMYVFLGTSIFYTLEHNLETDRREIRLQERIEINEILTAYTSPDDIELQTKILAKVSDYCGRKVTNHTLDEYPDPYVWNFFHAFYFSFTTCTTVGYGNISPSTSLGRIILCFYALFGIPISCFFIASVAHFFAATYVRLYQQYLEYKHANTKNYVPPALGFVGKICLYLTPGLVIFIFVPAIFFTYFEDWDYVRSVYYAFVTLSTVGYGDLVPTFQTHQEREFHFYFLIYEIFIIFWNIAGLGYVLMLINFVAKAMKCKRVAKWEHKISENIRATEHLVRQQVSKDLNFLRRLLNETVYADEDAKKQYHSLPRSSSCPELSMFHYRTSIRNARGRSYSVATGRRFSKLSTTTLNRTQSDGVLHLIDREKTFGNSAQVINGDLINRVVSALGSIRKYDGEQSSSEFGVNGFSDSQILANEGKCSGWSINRSEAGFHASRIDSLNGSNQLTWNGSNSHMMEDTPTSPRHAAFCRSVSLNMPEDDSNLQNIVNREVLSRILKKTNSPVSRLLSTQELLVKYTSPDNVTIQNEVLEKVSIYCKKRVTNHTLDAYVDPHVWSFYHSVFFSFTVCSTLGYGNITPTHSFGRYFMIVYALIGMPVNAILYTYLGEYFGKTFTRIYKRYKAYKLATNENYVPRRLGMIAQVSLYLVPASIVLIFLPSCLFTYFEGWSYSDSVYYSFVTLSTIGFGDFIPTFQPHQERVFGIYFQFYQAFVIIWLVFGLSYLLMLIGFIARGMRSKRITRLEHQLSENIKITQNRIWSGVTKDVSYLRRILNEIYMLKFKPVYDEPDDDFCFNNHFPRSASCPSLQLYRTNLLTEFVRKRTLSDYQVYPCDIDNTTLLSRHSESDLFRINKTKTFREKNGLPFDTGDVLARVVHALGNLTAKDDEGENIDDSNTITSVISIKSSEHEYSIPPAKPRLRAVSAYRKPSIKPIESPHKWTWNGTNTQIQEFRNMRHKLKIIDKEIVRDENMASTVKIDDSPLKPLIPALHQKLNPHTKINIPKLNVDHHQKRCSIVGVENVLPKRRPSRLGYLKPLPNPSSRRPSIFDIQENQVDKNLLENTTIADLIRALETAHTLNNSSHDPALQELLGVGPFMPPQRLNNRRNSMYPRYSEQVLMMEQQIPSMNGNLDSLSKLDPNASAQRRFSVHPNPFRRSSVTTSLKQRRQSMRPSHLMNNECSVTGRFTVSTRLRPTNSFRKQNNTLRGNRLVELNEKSDDKNV
ncbi:Open rectifier potassium channel protein 1 [Pseudolycoriella hygida]|uniref:Open rectifier potassium channel protein 1 n=1 Tax=Pseudolycoriella hygida TaxID=35572 RepID=A0A9Q0MNK7_9DIPT|nr:Open rectifier potassium channel protein 1 [Pseudolycoriella hygida]